MNSSAKPAATSTTTSRAVTPSLADWRRTPSKAISACCELEQLTGLVRGDNDHLVRTRLVCLENTHNRGSGRIQPYDEVVRICRWAHEQGLATHLDGARLFNAVVATGISARDWSQHFDTVSVCFSKGLRRPIGSALAGPKDLIAKARRARKLFGGGMRQAGIIAAAALYALEHHVERLADDHAHAKILADAVRSCPKFQLRPEKSTPTSSSSTSIRAWAPPPAWWPS